MLTGWLHGCARPRTVSRSIATDDLLDQRAARPTDALHHVASLFLLCRGPADAGLNLPLAMMHPHVRFAPISFSSVVGRFSQVGLRSFCSIMQRSALLSAVNRSSRRQDGARTEGSNLIGVLTGYVGRTREQPLSLRPYASPRDLRRRRIVVALLQLCGDGFSAPPELSRVYPDAV